MKEGFLSIGADKLYYKITGEGPPLVLIHGFSLDHRMWDAQVSALSTTHQVIVYDMRGFGRSTTTKAVGLKTHCEDIRRLIDFLNIDSIYLAGLSLGSVVAIEFALSNSDRVKRLALISSGIIGGPLSQAVVRFFLSVSYMLITTLIFGWASKGRDVWLNSRIFDSTRTKPEIFQVLKDIINDFKDPKFLLFSKKEYPNQYKRLNLIKARTMVIAGNLDLPYFLECADHLSSQIPSAELNIVPDSGHMLNMDCSMETNAALKIFFEELSIRKATNHKTIPEQTS